MKAELLIEHLIPYLQYNLKLQYIVRDAIAYTGTMRNISHNNNETHPTRVSIDNKYEEHIWMFKPILNQKAFLNNNIVQADIINTWGANINKDDIPLWLKNITDALLYGDYNSLPYKYIQLMAKYHIDMFNLIDNNLATPINNTNANEL